jgi:hypothetical protein
MSSRRSRELEQGVDGSTCATSCHVPHVTNRTRSYRQQKRELSEKGSASGRKRRVNRAAGRVCWPLPPATQRPLVGRKRSQTNLGIIARSHRTTESKRKQLLPRCITRLSQRTHTHSNDDQGYSDADCMRRVDVRVPTRSPKVETSTAQVLSKSLRIAVQKKKEWPNNTDGMVSLCVGR